MKFIFKIANRLFPELFDETVDLKQKRLILTFCYGFLLIFSSFILFISFKYDISLVYLSLAVMVLNILILILIRRYNEIDYYCFFVVGVYNFLILPVIFLVSGDVLFGGTLYLVIGIMLSCFLVDGCAVCIILLIELLYYCEIIRLCGRNESILSIYRDSDKSISSVIFVFVFISFVSMFMIVYISNLYKRKHKEVLEAKHSIEESKVNKSKFLSNMTNEIRTPMNAILGMNELIMREELDPTSKELAQMIQDSSGQLLKIVNNILEFSKLDSGKMELFPEKYNVRELINGILDVAAAEYDRDNIEFVAKIDPNIPSFLFGDSVRIRQVFMYLLFSTIHRLSHSRVVFEISADINENTNSVLLKCCISESGEGLSANEINSMLSAYSRYDSRQASDYKGMALEFCICDEILKLMGGSIDIQSVKSVGTSISFDILNYIIEDRPVAKVLKPDVTSVLVYIDDRYDEQQWADIFAEFFVNPHFVFGPNAFRSALEDRKYTHIFVKDVYYELVKDTLEASSCFEQTYIISARNSVYEDFGKCRIIRRPITSLNVSDALNNKWDENEYKNVYGQELTVYPNAKVLIIDDSIVNLKVLSGVLESFRIKADMSQSGDDALKLVDSKKYHLIIVDQRMPYMDGSEFLHIIKGLKFNPNSNTPVICATADFGAEVEKLLLETGFDGYLAKPVRKHYLERVLVKYLPSDLAEKVIVEDTPKMVVEQSEKEKKDPLEIIYDKGIENVGGSDEVYGVVLNSYYYEGLEKIGEIRSSMETDISLYTTDVHALKSSSASIGAGVISGMFKDLEFAGRGKDLDFIHAHTASVLESFEKLLEKVKEYLVEKEIFEDRSVATDDEPMELGEEISLDKDIVIAMQDALNRVDLKTVEEIIESFDGKNYGFVVNPFIKDIKAQYEMFDYQEVKDTLAKLLDVL